MKRGWLTDGLSLLRGRGHVTNRVNLDQHPSAAAVSEGMKTGTGGRSPRQLELSRVARTAAGAGAGSESAADAGDSGAASAAARRRVTGAPRC